MRPSASWPRLGASVRKGAGSTAPAGVTTTSAPALRLTKRRPSRAKVMAMGAARPDAKTASVKPGGRPATADGAPADAEVKPAYACSAAAGAASASSRSSSSVVVVVGGGGVGGGGAIWSDRRCV